MTGVDIDGNIPDRGDVTSATIPFLFSLAVAGWPNDKGSVTLHKPHAQLSGTIFAGLNGEERTEYRVCQREVPHQRTPSLGVKSNLRH